MPRLVKTVKIYFTMKLMKVCKLRQVFSVEIRSGIASMEVQCQMRGVQITNRCRALPLATSNLRANLTAARATGEKASLAEINICFIEDRKPWSTEGALAFHIQVGTLAEVMDKKT